MRQKLFFIAIVAFVSAMIAPVASAEKPIKEPAPSPTTFTGQFCKDFMVQLNIVVNKEQMKTFENGRVIISGRLVIEAINLETEESITVNVSGPVFIDDSGEIVILRGRTLLFGEAGDFGPGTPATLVVVSGTVTLRAGVPGYTVKGHTRDLCSELAA